MSTLVAGFLTIGILMTATHSPRTQKARPEVEPPDSEMRPLIERYSADRGSLGRFYNLDGSASREKRFAEFYKEWQKRLEGVAFDSMSRDGKIDYILFRNHLDHAATQQEIEDKQREEAKALVPFGQTILKLEDDRRHMLPLDPEKAADTLNDLKKEVEKAHKAIEDGPKASKTLANRAAGEVDDLRESLKSWFDFYHGYDPLFSWWNDAPYKAADQTLEGFAKFVREKQVGIKPDDKTTIVGDPIGKDALLEELKFEMVPYSPEELVKIADKEFAWCEAEMKKASREMGFGDDWKKALEKVKTLHVEPGKQPALIKDLALEAIDYVKKHDLVTVPPIAEETWRMEMMSPERQLVNPFFTGGEVISVSFPVADMTFEQKQMSMRGNNVHFARATVFHELIPGHHLQGFMTQRYRPYRRVFGTPFWLEGWALYWEMLLWDMGFAKSPENRVGMLFWRMHRCARIIFSLNFNLGKWTPEQCIDFLVDRVGHERENAVAEVRRSFNGTYPPLYQAAYMLGGLQIRALHRELVDSGKMTNRDFHDAILKGNSIPIEMVRASLTDVKLTRDYTPNWRFYGNP